MSWNPNAQLGIAVYRQIAQHFEEQILTGKLSPGEHLPAERSLAKSLGVNRSTVTASYEELRASGLVKSVQGSGTKVSEDLWGYQSTLLLLGRSTHLAGFFARHNHSFVEFGKPVFTKV
ncbi:winged helix-turn-helix domain-containing protein [Alicyclobacillus fastidiosus]|uniref:winged helix-turn-helix domain-containing protein n=1 Tax=Alicyclobacillus fastidiosus TaxID=392011 RepID=UPI0023EA247D|nr:winged helix-turn-helix domain-containing protein [Alicyclobacillus fastidiosus]GMA61043.1 hypothetical protein GCM10025859_14830 [Alicyclobacillus fastidiosus]